jgi:hypothetical protein
MSDNDVGVGHEIASHDHARGRRPVHAPEVFTLARRAGMRKCQELFDVSRGQLDGKRPREDGRVRAYPQVARDDRPEQIEELGSSCELVDQLESLAWNELDSSDAYSRTFRSTVEFTARPEPA